MLADKVRNPLAQFQSRIGVFPVAIRTIMVSPMARPKPIMTAEKIPGLADNKTRCSTVCQRVAPNASEPAMWDFGTLESASSAIL